MSLIVGESWETGTNGTAVTSSNTIAETVSGNCTISTAWSITGTRSMDCNASGSSAASRMPLGGNYNIVATVVYLRVIGSSAPSSNTAILVARKSTTAYGDVQVQSNGRLRVRNGGTQVWTATDPLPTDTDLRVEYLVNATAGTQSVSVYPLHGTTPIAGQSSGTLAYGGSAVDNINIGIVQNCTYHLRMDAFATYSSAADLPAPAFTAPSVSFTLDPNPVDITDDPCLIEVTVSGGDGSPTITLEVVSGPSTDPTQFDDYHASSTYFTPIGGPGSYVIKVTVTDTVGSATQSRTLVVTGTVGIQFIKTIVQGVW